MIIVGMAFTGQHYFEVLNLKETVNSERYVTFLKNMIIKFSRHVNPISWKDLVLQHDNARPHVSHYVSTFLANKSATLMKQPAYSPDYNLCDRLIFPQMEMSRVHKTLENPEEITQFVCENLHNLQMMDMMRHFDKLRLHLLKIIELQGEYC